MPVTIGGSGTITGLSATGISAEPVFPGNVIQVVSATYSTETSSSSTSYADTGLTASITPTSSSSKVLVLVCQNGISKNSGNLDNSVNLKLFRGASELAVTFYVGYTGTTITNYTGTVSFCYLDSPATTSSTTYKTQFANYVAASNVKVQNNSAVSIITLLEVAA